MTDKQQRFIDEYLVDCNATQAAIRAGYSEKTAGQIGDENLKKPEIADAIAKRRLELQETTQITQEYVLAMLKENLERAMTVVPVTDKDGNETGEFKYEGTVANKSLELLGRHLKMFTDKTEHTGASGGPIEFIEIAPTAARDEPV